MKISLLFLSNVLLAATVLAAPSRLADRIERRATRTRGSRPPQIVGSAVINEGLDSVTEVEYSENWAGAVLTAPPSGQTFNAVSAQFTVPTPSTPSSTSKSGTYAASAWVGIDGDTYQDAILQTGIDFTVTKSSSKSTVSFDAWYEWYPDYAYDFSLTVSAGDVIALSVVSTSSTAGTATIDNITTGKSVSISLTAPSSSSKLGGQNAEWIVEDFEEGDSLIAFADFGSVIFTDCVASTSSESLGVTGAAILDIEQSNKVLTSVTLVSSSEVEVTYV